MSQLTQEPNNSQGSERRSLVFLDPHVILKQKGLGLAPCKNRSLRLQFNCVTSELQAIDLFSNITTLALRNCKRGLSIISFSFYLARSYRKMTAHGAWRNDGLVFIVAPYSEWGARGRSLKSSSSHCRLPLAVTYQRLHNSATIRPLGLNYLLQ